MRTRTLIWLVCGLYLVGAAYNGSLAALYVTLFGTWIMYCIHAIEVKINRPLDDRGITVTNVEIAKD